MLGFFLEAETLILPDSVQKAQWKQIVERFTSLDAETFLRDFTGQVIWVALKIAVAFAIYAAGRWIINRLVRLMDASFDRRQVDKSLRSFLRSLVKGAAYTILLLIIVQLLGFNTTSLVALLAASGFGIGMALSGTLQNFAGGIMVMFMHPYRIGDYIEAQVTVHHTRKQPAGDSFETISGTTGLLGCADGALLMQKKKRTALEATVDAVGRDQQDQILYLKKDA